MADDVKDEWMEVWYRAYNEGATSGMGYTDAAIRHAVAAVAPMIRAAECATLRARVVELEGALLGMMDVTDDYGPSPVEDARDIARAALNGAKP